MLSTYRLAFGLALSLHIKIRRRTTMDNKETIVRDTHYEYDEKGNLTSMTINETITNPALTRAKAAPAKMVSC